MGRKVRTKIIPDYSRHWLKEGVSRLWLKFIIKKRSEKMKKSNEGGQVARQVRGRV